MNHTYCLPIRCLCPPDNLTPRSPMVVWYLFGNSSITKLCKFAILAAFSTASLFILINSISGILGQLTKENIINDLIIYWPLFFSVLIGGFVGNHLNLKVFSNKTLTIMTSVLVMLVSIRIGINLFF